ncbi:unnamed protein product [Prunus armeniaca]
MKRNFGGKRLTSEHLMPLKNIWPSLRCLFHQSGSLLAQDNDEKKEQAVYYLSRILTATERKYSPMEKLFLALYFTVTKLRHYMLPFVVHIIAKTDLIKYMLTRPIIRGRIRKWTMALALFTFRYVPQ